MVPDGTIWGAKSLSKKRHPKKCQLAPPREGANAAHSREGATRYPGVPSWHPDARVPRGTLRLGTLGTLIRRCQMAPFEVTFLDRNLAPQMVLSGIIYYCVLQVIYLLTRNHLGS